MSEPVLSVRDLVVSYPHGRRPGVRALEGVSIDIGSGETLGLVGESGSGKSTLAHAVLGLVPVRTGRVVFDGTDVTRASTRQRRDLSQHVQLMFQDPYSSLNPSRTVRQTMIEPLLVHRKLTGKQMRAEVEAMLHRVGLPADAAHRYPAEFSGGQRQRIAIARALMVSPRLIICDEVTSALDLSIQAQILNLLTDLQHEFQLSYLFISHDLDVVRHVAHRIAVLHNGMLVETGTAEQVYAAPRESYTRRLLAAALLPDPDVQQARRTARQNATAMRSSPDTHAGGPRQPPPGQAPSASADPPRLSERW